MALTPDDLALVEKMRKSWDAARVSDERLLRYYLGSQRVEQLGMAIPPSMRRFLLVANWPRVLVDTIERRQNVRSLILPGQESEDARLREMWNANNLDADLTLFNLDRLIYGRAFLSVGANEDSPDLPLIHVESPREVQAVVDVRQRRMLAAARFRMTDDESAEPDEITLMRPDFTSWLRKQPGGKWVEVDRDEHRLGRVPIVMHLNRRMSGSWLGESEMTDIIPLTDGAARALTNLQFAQESHGIPRMFMTGVSRGDFIGKDGKPIPQWEAYFNAIHTLTEPSAKVGQLDAADLKNFETAVNLYGKQAATVSGFPARYFGQHTTNPPAEGAIRADEAQLVEGVQRHNAATGTTLGWAMGLAYRFATGEWAPGNRIRVDWFDPATPTYSQRADAIMKMRSEGVLSREGAWDELGWAEARKTKERAYLAAEQSEGLLTLKVGDADLGA